MLGACLVSVFVSFTIRLGYSVALPEMIRDLDLGRTGGGTIYNAYLLTYIATTPLTGYLADRLGGRRVITACALILGAGTVLMGLSRSLPAAAAAFALTGLGAAGIWTPTMAVVQRWFAPHRKGLPLGLLIAATGTGFAMTGWFLPWIVRRFSWHEYWLILGGAAWLAAAVDGFFLRSDPGPAGWRPWGVDHGEVRPAIWGPRPDRAAAEDAGRQSLAVPIVSRASAGAEGPSRTPAASTAAGPASVRAVLRSPTFWLIGGSFFAVSYGLYGLTTFMVDYAHVQLGLPLERAGLLATVHGTAQVFGGLTVLPLSDRWGRRRTLLVTSSTIAAILLGVLLAGGEWRLLFVLVAALGFLYGPNFALFGACAGDYFPGELIGTVVGSWTPFFGLGAIGVHWVTGLLRDATGTYTAAFAINVVVVVVSVGLMAAVKRRVSEAGRQRPTRDVQREV